MSEQEFQHESDDELLSAYLDGELTDEERAAVEARIANDPDAQQLLQQLRGVSQAVQKLPLEPVGRDLRDEILRRAESVKPDRGARVSDESIPGLGTFTPKPTIFQTRRSWFWASLAVAAGLMIMVLQSGKEEGKNVPGMAPPNGGLAVNRQLKEAPPPMVNAPARSDTAKLAQDGSARPPASAPSPSPMAAAGALAAREKVPATPKSPLAPLSVDGLAQNEMPSRPNASIAQSGPELKGEFLSRTPAEEARAGSTAAAGAPSPAPASVAMGVRRESQLAARKLTAAPPAGGASPAAAAPAFMARDVPNGSEPSREESQPAPDSLVVVHVVAKPAAFRSGAFDQLLVRNGIAVEPASEKDELAKAANRPEKTGEAIHAADKADANAAGGNMDVLLVDAPEPAVVSCLATLQRDSTNYVGVEVDQPPVNRERAGAKSPPEKKLTIDLGQFNRGFVSEKQKILDRNQYLFYHMQDKDYSAGVGKPEDGFRAAYNRKLQQESSQQSPEQSPRTDDRGRARRISQSNREKEGANARTAGGGGTAGAGTDESLALRRAQMELKSANRASTDNLQVLFVVSPASETAASAPAEKSAE